MHKRKISNYFVDPKFQGKFMAFLLLSTMIPISISLGIIAIFIKQNYSILVQFGDLDQTMVALLNHELKVLIASVGISFGACILLIGVVGLLFSHRIAGPIYALRRDIRRLMQEGHGTITVRPGDEWQDFVRELNQLISALRTMSSDRKISRSA